MFQLLQPFFQQAALHPDSLKDARKIRLGQQAAETVHIHSVELRRQSVNALLGSLHFGCGHNFFLFLFHCFLRDGQQRSRIEIRSHELPHTGYNCIRDSLFLDGMASAGPCPCEPLIGAAHEIQHILPCRIFAVLHRKRVPALMAEDQPFQQKVVRPVPGMCPAAEERTHFFKTRPVDKRRVCAFHHHPVFAGLPFALF